MLDDWLSRQRMEELLAISDELKQHRTRLHDLLQEYARTHSEKTREEIEREIRAIEQRIAELEAKAQKLAGEVADRFMNADAADEQNAEDCFAKVRELVNRGEIAAADKQLERCAREADAQAQEMEQGLRGLRSDRFNEEEKAYGELLGEVMDLEREQRKLAGDAEELQDRYKKRAAEAARDKQEPAGRQGASKTLDKLRKEVGEIPRDGLTPFSQEEYDALKQRIEDTGRMLDDGDLAEALALSRHIQDELKHDRRRHRGRQERRAAAVGQDRRGGRQGRPCAADRRSARRGARAGDAVAERDDERRGSRRSAELRRRQRQLRERAERLAQKAQKKAKDLPGQAGETTQKGLGEAGEQMGRAEERFGAPDPMSARDEAQGAADKLGDLQKKMNRSARPSMVGQNGRNPDEEPVKIPGSDEYKPPEAFREDILDAMKKEKPPDAYKDQVKRYYEELVK